MVNWWGEIHTNSSAGKSGDVESHGGEWVKFNGLFRDIGHQGPCGPYKLCNHNLYIGIIIFPHIDNTQYTGHK